MSELFTIGHSTKPLDQFLEELHAYKIELLVDVRSFPMSRRYPHFNKDSLEASLSGAGIKYRWMKALGGRRKTLKDSPNTGWRNASFRGYADYMGTPEFEVALTELETLAKEHSVAIMCAEAVPWRCHRSLIADALTLRRSKVQNIFDASHAKPHALNPMARLVDGIITYPPQQESLI